MYNKAKMLRKVRENLSKGGGMYNACEAAGIPYITVWSWRNKYPRIERYFTRLLTQRVQLIEDALYKAALKGNTAAQIFYLKNRASDKWTDKRELIGQGFAPQVVNIIRTEPKEEPQAIDQTKRT